MEFQLEQLGETQTVLHAAGRLDAETSPLLRQAIFDLAEKKAAYVVVNLGQVDFMDSSGLSALVSGMKALQKSGGKLAICHANDQIRTALRLTMLDRVFPAYHSATEAMQALRTSQS